MRVLLLPHGFTYGRLNRSDWETGLVLFPIPILSILGFAKDIITSNENKKGKNVESHSQPFSSKRTHGEKIEGEGERGKKRISVLIRTQCEMPPQVNPLMSIDIDLQQIYDLREYGSIYVAFAEWVFFMPRE